jgi:hypothetical protein
MPVTCAEIRELVIAACRDLQTQEIPNIKATAREHGAPPVLRGSPAKGRQ